MPRKEVADYYKSQAFSTTVRLYNGDRMPVTEYRKVWVDEPHVEEAHTTVKKLPVVTLLLSVEPVADT